MAFAWHGVQQNLSIQINSSKQLRKYVWQLYLSTSIGTILRHVPSSEEELLDTGMSLNAFKIVDDIWIWSQSDA